MAKQESIQNIYDGPGTLDVYDRKYLRYFAADYTDKISLDVFNAIKTKDINVIEGCLKDLSSIASNYLLHIGLICLVIERERLYEGTEYGVSYLRYADHLLSELDIPIATLSEAKIIVEQFILHNAQLSKAGFKLARNSIKLRYLPEALENHPESEVFKRIVNNTFREFRDWAQKKSIARFRKPAPDVRVEAEIKGNQLLINGKNVLNFPRDTPPDIRDMIMKDLQATFSIREEGNEPFIVSTYGKGEQRALESYLKKFREKK